VAPRYTTEPCTTSNERGEAKWGRVAGLYNSSNSLTPESSNTSSWLSSCGKHLHTECLEALAAIFRVGSPNVEGTGKTCKRTPCCGRPSPSYPQRFASLIRLGGCTNRRRVRAEVTLLFLLLLHHADSVTRK
jgi:hypothetical protein